MIVAPIGIKFSNVKQDDLNEERQCLLLALVKPGLVPLGAGAAEIWQQQLNLSLLILGYQAAIPAAPSSC